MSIPDFQTLMLPVLRQAEGGEAQIGEAIQNLADHYNLTDAERSELLPSGRQTKFANRVHWAKSYLGKAALVELTGRGKYKITSLGTQVLASPPSRITIKFLSQFPEFKSFRSDISSDAAVDAGESEEGVATLSAMTPDEVMREARDALEQELGSELLSRILAAPPEFFEKLVVRLVTAMGYGGSIADAGKALGKSGDGGVDGVIDEDALGLDRIYVQAKRYGEGNPVGPGAIRDFFGALDQVKANKGLFVTTSTFTASAAKTALDLSKRIVLIDGSQLTRLMIRFGVGCRVEETMYVKKLDEDFFEPA